MPTVTVPGAKRESLFDRAKAGLQAGVDRYRARRRDKKKKKLGNLLQQIQCLASLA